MRREQAPDFPPSLLTLAVVQRIILVALIYTVAVFVLGWVMGGPNVIDGRRILDPTTFSPVASMWVRGALYLLCFAFALLVLKQSSPSPQAVFTRLAQTRGPLLSWIAIILVLVCTALVFAYVHGLMGGPLFLSDLGLITTSGMISGAFAQVLAAAAQPNKDRPVEKATLDRLVEDARNKAIENDLDPDDAERVARESWDRSGKSISQFFQTLNSIVMALSGGGIHGGILFVLGASFFIGLGVGISGPAVCLFYFVPLMIALADLGILFTSDTVMRRTENSWPVWVVGIALSVFIGVVGMVCKAAILIVGAVSIRFFGGPDIYWQLYRDAMFSDPFGTGLTATLLLLICLPISVSVFIPPVRRFLLH